VANLTIANVSDPLYRHLNEQARLKGRSLKDQVIHVLQCALEEYTRFQKKRESNQDLERLVAFLPLVDDSTSLIREDRDRDT
jgi:plasmid stability protein